MVIMVSPSIYSYRGGPFAVDGLVVDVEVPVAIAAAVVAFGIVVVVVMVTVSVAFSAVGETPAAAAPPSRLVADLGSSALDTGFKGVVPTDGRAAAALFILLL